MVNINQINELTQALGGTSGGAPKTEKTGVFENALTQALEIGRASCRERVFRAV